MSLTLYSPSGNIRASKIIIAAEFLKIPLQHKNIQYKDLKSKQYLAKHPLGKVPLLETPEGNIFESFTILRYIARKANALYGDTPFQKAQVETWLDSTLAQLDPLVMKLLGAVCGWNATTETVYNSILKEFKDWLKNTDSHLKDKTYLVGNSITISDLAVASYLHAVFRVHLDQKARSSFPHLMRWYNQISFLQPFLTVLGKTWFCEKEFPFIPKQETVQSNNTQKLEKPKEKPEGGKVDKKQKKQQQSKPEQKKKQKKQKKQKAEDDEDEEPAPVEKKINPLDLLPKSSFVLDDFKRQISNTADKLSVVKSFWQKFDSQGWSLWKSVYDKYGDQGKVGYLTSNLKNGFLRNLDHFRKYSFGTFGVYGVQGNYDIKGVWLWRGTQVPQQIKQHQSYQYYKFNRLSHQKEEDRSTVEEYWSKLQQGQIVEGAPVFDAKYFK